jgi:hypothetical protein
MERYVSSDQQLELVDALGQLKWTYDMKSGVVVPADMGHGLSTCVISQVLSNCEHMCTVDMLLESCGVWSFEQALDLLAISW